jgi:hypothetical protein
VGIKEGQYGKPDLTLGNGRRFSLNATNTKVLVNAFGRNSNDYLGQQIELYAGTIKFKGENQDSVLVRPITSGRPEAERTPLPAQDEIEEEIPF